jgi:PTH1 family peptidyl-tRNA hydrolase
LSLPLVVACLGNPGKRYSMTWHNAGFWVADILTREAGVKFLDAGLFLVASLPGDRTIIKPTVYMNLSGRSVSAFMNAEELDPDRLLVVCDDFNLDLGRLRLKASGSSGGHNGLQSIIDCLGSEEFPRLRMGIGPAPEKTDLAAFVLDRVPSRLEEEASLMAHRAADCVVHCMTEGISSAQELYNRNPEEV